MDDNRMVDESEIEPIKTASPDEWKNDREHSGDTINLGNINLGGDMSRYITYRDFGFMGERDILVKYDYEPACKGGYEEGMQIEPDSPASIDSVEVWIIDYHGHLETNVTPLISDEDAADLEREIITHEERNNDD